MSDQKILRYQVMLMENPGLTIPPCEVLNPAILLPTLRGLSPLSLLSRNLGPLDKTQRGIVRRSSDQSWKNLVHWWKQLRLGWKKKSWVYSILQFWDHRGQASATRYFSQISWAHSPDSSFRTGKRKKNSHLHWLQVCLSGATCTCLCLERKGPLDHPRVPNQIWWSDS